MENLTYEAFLDNPEAVMLQVSREASRSRALAVHQYIFAPLARFCGALLAIRGVKLRLDPRVTMATTQ